MYSLSCFFLLLVLSFPLAAEPIFLTFSDLENSSFVHQIDGKEIEIKGFIYEKNERVLILASQPNLKSCCIGSKDKISQQIVVNGIIPVSMNVMHLQGIFKTDPHYNAKGEISSLYALNEVKVIQKKSYLKYMVGAFIGLGLISLLFRNAWKRFNAKAQRR